MRIGTATGMGKLFLTHKRIFVILYLSSKTVRLFGCCTT